MNYNVFKTLVDVLVKTYKCPNCKSEINENSLDIVGTAGTTINVDIACPSCKRHSIIKAEATQVNPHMMDFAPGTDLETIKKTLSNMFLNKQNKENSIKDIDIINLNKDLNNTELLTVEDLFKSE